MAPVRFELTPPLTRLFRKANFAKENNAGPFRCADHYATGPADFILLLTYMGNENYILHVVLILFT